MSIFSSSGTFTLRVEFGAPDGLFLNPVEVVGLVFGIYTSENTFALIDFVAEEPAMVNFDDPVQGAGQFTLAVKDVCLFMGTPCETSDYTDGGPILTKLRRHKLLNALAFNTPQRGDGNVKFVKAKGSSRMFGPVQENVDFTITATITLTEFFPTNSDQCKKDGWKNFITPSFKNQGDCVSFNVPK